MKKLYFLALTLCLPICSNLFAQATSQLDSISFKLLGTRTPGIEIVDYFHSTTSPHFQDPKAPRFLLYDQQHKVAFGIGGYVRVRTFYDFGGSPTSPIGFVPYTIPVPVDPLTKNAFNMDASKSTVFFKLLGNNDKIGQFQAYVAGHFAGSGNSFELTDAYVTLLGLTIGRTWSTFNDLAVVPPTVDFQGPNGAAEMRTTQIRYTNNLNENFSFAIAAEMPHTTGTFFSGQTVKTTQRIPDIPLYLQYNWGKNLKSHVRVAGVLRNMNYRDALENKTETSTGIGYQFSSKLILSNLLTFYGQVTYGKGVAQYINDLSGNGLSLTPKPNHIGKMEAQEALGWFAQMQFNISKSVFSTVGYSQAKVFYDSALANPANYNYGQYLVGNVFYNLTSDIQLGVEYLWGDRKNTGGDHAAANRIQTLVQFNF